MKPLAPLLRTGAWALPTALITAFTTACSAQTPPCDAALAALQRYAQAQGLQVDARCRAAASATAPAPAAVQAVAPRDDWRPRSGPLTWPVRVLGPSGRAQVQHVPLTAVWTAPAWAAARPLPAGALLQPADIERRSLRWPEGRDVTPADGAQPPTGRLQHAMRAGEILSPADLLPEDAMQRGDAVTAVLAEGGVEMRLPAQLLAPARVGERVRVQASGRMVALEGRLLAGQILQVGSP